MRQKHMSNRVYADEDELWTAVETGWDNSYLLNVLLGN
jgi:hypothetical protein